LSRKSGRPCVPRCRVAHGPQVPPLSGHLEPSSSAANVSRSSVSKFLAAVSPSSPSPARSRAPVKQSDGSGSRCPRGELRQHGRPAANSRTSDDRKPLPPGVLGRSRRSDPRPDRTSTRSMTRSPCAQRGRVMVESSAPSARRVASAPLRRDGPSSSAARLPRTARRLRGDDPRHVGRGVPVRAWNISDVRIDRQQLRAALLHKFHHERPADDERFLVRSAPRLPAS